MNALIDRIRAERRELNERLIKLYAFINTPKFFALDNTSRVLLAEQASTMSVYLRILDRRLEHLGNPDNRPIGEPVETGGHDIDRDGPPAFFD
mgnify:CR=1 FL=1